MEDVNMDSTATDFQPSNSKNEKKMTRRELDSHIVRLMLEEPFYAGVLRGVNYVETCAIPTAGVSTKDLEINFYWNPYFLGSLSREEICGLLKHESMHLALDHTTNRRMEPHIVHNYATDLAINCDIPKNELPEGGLVPGEKFKDLSEEQKKKMSQEAIDRYNRISEKISQFPTHMSSEWYFTKILEDQDLSDDVQQSGDDEAIGMDSHEGWGELSESERELMKAKIRKSVEEAVKEADSTGRWGSVGSEVRGELRKLISNDVNWRAVLRQFCGMLRRGTRTTSWTRVNRKYAGMVAGAKRGYTSSIAVYIDQSGSVDDNSLELAFAELRNLSSKIEFTTFHFDTEVDQSSETVWKRGKTPEAIRTRCGGTNFETVTRHANENRHKFDGYIIITDGEAPKPSPSKMKRGWLIIPNRNLVFEPSNRDFVMKMKEAS